MVLMKEQVKEVCAAPLAVATATLFGSNLGREPFL
jgi:hypothetical protein